MSETRYDIVVLGLSLTSSWGNGHATTFRALLRGLATLGRRVLFLERDVSWYAAHRDLVAPEFCTFHLYDTVAELKARFHMAVSASHAVIVGSYVPDGIAVLDWVLATATGVRVFYDIDTPVTLTGLDNGGVPYLAASQIPLLDLYLSFAGGPLLDRLADRFGARRPLAFYCAVDETAYRRSDVRTRWDLGYLGTYSADRQPALERFLLATAHRLPAQKFVVAGPQYPGDIVWPANVERIEHVPPASHADFYSAQRFTLNITRADMIAAGWSPSVRLFEAASCETPIISDRWPGLTDLLPDREAVRIADTTDDVVATLRDDSASPQIMAERAKKIVHARHTGVARAAELLSYMSLVRGLPQPGGQ